MQPKKLSPEFYSRKDVVKISRELLGKFLFTRFNGKITGGVITETEAYEGIADKASHAWNGRRTARTEIMYKPGGVAYVYLCYGIHSLFNIVTNKENIPHAVLVRGIMPTHGIKTMLKRRNKKKVDSSFSSGPGTAAQALGIHYSHSGIDLNGNKIWIEDRNIKIRASMISVSKRIGVEYSGEDAHRLNRFVLKIIPGQIPF